MKYLKISYEQINNTEGLDQLIRSVRYATWSERDQFYCIPETHPNIAFILLKLPEAVLIPETHPNIAFILLKLPEAVLI